MEMTQSNLNSIFFAFNAAFKDAFAKPTRPIPSCAMVIPSTTAEAKLPIVVLKNVMRRWEGSFKIDNVNVEYIHLENEDYKNAVEVSRNAIEDDTFGLFTPIFSDMATTAANLPAQLVGRALVNPGNWADGLPFFATRKIGKSSFKNTFNGELSADNFVKAYEQMTNFRAPDGETPADIMPDTLIVGPKLRMAAKKILEREWVVENGAAVDNIVKGMCKLEVINEIQDETWFVAACGGSSKPIAYLDRKRGNLVRLDKETDECAEARNVNRYSVHCRGTAALVAPHLIIQCTK